MSTSKTRGESPRRKIVLLHPVMETGALDYHPIMPMGFFSMAHQLERAGHDITILNAAVQRRVQPDWTPEADPDVAAADVVGVGLHWYLHSDAATSVLGRVKGRFPEKRVIFGGYTATYFARELMATYPNLDGVVLGDGEQPLVALAEHLAGDWHDVPNLMFRSPAGIEAPRTRWYANGDELDSYRFSRLDLLKHSSIYLQLAPGSPVVGYANTPIPFDHVFYLTMGRRCPLGCPYCGGAGAVALGAGHSGQTVLRSLDRVADDLEALWAAGVTNVYLEYDPNAYALEQHAAFFARLRHVGIRPGINVEAWSPPGMAYLTDFAATVDLSRSGITISPDTGSESLRRQTKRGPFLTNGQLLSWVGSCQDVGIMPTLCFTVGLPFETPTDFQETARLVKVLRRAGVNLGAMAFKLEPGAPIFERPEEFGVTRYRHTFADYVSHTRALTAGHRTQHILGYRTASFSEGDILSMQARLVRTAYLHPWGLWDRLRRRGATQRGSARAVLGALLGSGRQLQLALRE